MRLFLVIGAGAGCVFASAKSATSGAAIAKVERSRVHVKQMFKVRPYRASRKVRYQNLNDIEVRSIESVVRSIHPGAIVNISEVTLDCPCEDGASCEAQVGVVAVTESASVGLLLSRIKGTWDIGPLQQWWLDHDAIWAQYYAEGVRSWQAVRTYEGLIDRLEERFPDCASLEESEDGQDKRHAPQR